MSLLLLFGGAVSAAVMCRAPLFAEPPPSAPFRNDGPVGNPTLLAPPTQVQSPFFVLPDGFKRAARPRDDGPKLNALLPLGLGSTVAPAMTRAALEPHRWSPPWRDDGPKRGIAPLGIGQGAQASAPFTVLEAVRTRVPAPRADGPTVSQALVYAVQLYAPWDGAQEPRKPRQSRQDGPVSSTLYVPGETPAAAYLRTEIPPTKRSVQAREDGPGRNLVALGAGVGESAAPAMARTIHFPVPRSKANRDDGPIKGIAPLGIGAGQQTPPLRSEHELAKRSKASRDDGPNLSGALLYAVQLYHPFDGHLETARRSAPPRNDGPGLNLIALGFGSAGEPVAPALTRTPIFADPPPSRAAREDGPLGNVTLLIPRAVVVLPPVDAGGSFVSPHPMPREYAVVLKTGSYRIGGKQIQLEHDLNSDALLALLMEHSKGVLPPLF